MLARVAFTVEALDRLVVVHHLSEGAQCFDPILIVAVPKKPYP